MAVPSFLGTGLLRPFRRDQKLDFASASGETLVRACVGQILGTMCANDTGTVQGELPWRPEFGSLLYYLKHHKGPLLQQLAQVYVARALARWEPRVVITASQVTLSETLLTIRIRYNVIDRNVPGNQVVLRDIDQTISIPLAA